MSAFKPFYIKTTPFRDPIPPKGIPAAYEVAPMLDRPVSTIRHIASGQTAEAMTLDDFSSPSAASAPA